LKKEKTARLTGGGGNKICLPRWEHRKEDQGVSSLKGTSAVAEENRYNPLITTRGKEKVSTNEDTGRGKYLAVDEKRRNPP